MALMTSVNLKGLLTDRPAAAASNAGWLFTQTDSGGDGAGVYRSDGTDWELIATIGGSGNDYTTPPAVSAWTWVNQSTATATDVSNGVFLNGVATGSINWRCLVKSAPATPYVITACLLPVIIGGTSEAVALVFRQSSDGKLIVFEFQFNSSTSEQVLTVSKYDSATSFSAHYSPFPVICSSLANQLWLRIADNGTNRVCSVSADGINWVQVHSIGRTDFLTANQVGFAVNPRSGDFATAATLVSWLEA